MALDSETEVPDTEVVVDEEQQDQTTAEQDDDTTSEGGEGQGTGSEADDTDEVLITIGDPPSESTDDPQQHDTEALRSLRKAHREQTSHIRELERELKALKAGGAKAEVELGAKPKMSDPDINFDEDAFEQRLDEWKQRKQAHDDRQRQAQEAQKQADEAWQERQAAYGTQKSTLKVKDFEDAEGEAFTALSEVQRAVILHGAENAAHVVYALGKNPAELKRIAAITEPVKFAFAIAKLEDKVKVTPRKPPPAPERVVRGQQAGGADRRLEQLRADASKSGDYTKVIAYKRELAAKKSA